MLPPWTVASPSERARLAMLVAVLLRVVGLQQARPDPGGPALTSEGVKEMAAPSTLFEKVWQDHVVREPAGEPALIYIDLHLVHEVTSPQAFEGLRLSGRKVRRPDLTVATMDHNVPTTDRTLPITDVIAKLQMDTLARNCEEFGITLYDLHDRRQGIVHVIGPELGLTQPGQTIVCGDSHTSTHGAFGALAFG